MHTDPSECACAGINLPKLVLVLLEHLKGFGEDGADRAAAHLDPNVLVVRVLAGPGDLWPVSRHVLFTHVVVVVVVVTAMRRLTSAL
jgi:hypothetical protein